MSARQRGLKGLLARLLGARAGADVQEPARPGDGRVGAGRRGRAGASGSRARNGLSGEEVTSPLSLDRLERMITGPMGYGVRRHGDGGYACLLGTWDGFPFVIEELEDHPGWLLVSGDAQDPVRPGERDEVAASVNDWNRDKYYPTVSLIETPIGTVVRATYIVDLSSGVTSEQLRLHLDTALSACTQALSHVGPLLPEL